MLCLGPKKSLLSPRLKLMPRAWHIVLKIRDECDITQILRGPKGACFKMCILYDYFSSWMLPFRIRVDSFRQKKALVNSLKDVVSFFSTATGKKTRNPKSEIHQKFDGFLMDFWKNESKSEIYQKSIRNPSEILQISDKFLISFFSVFSICTWFCVFLAAFHYNHTCKTKLAKAVD